MSYHEVLAAEDDPEGEQHGVEDALPDVSKQQHPGPVEADGEPLHWDVDESHGDPQSEDHPEGRENNAIFRLNANGLYNLGCETLQILLHIRCMFIQV